MVLDFLEENCRACYFHIVDIVNHVSWLKAGFFSVFAVYFLNVNAGDGHAVLHCSLCISKVYDGDACSRSAFNVTIFDK